MGVILVGQGFVVEPGDTLVGEEPQALKSYLVGNELNQTRKHRFVIDFFGLTQNEARQQFPISFQRVLDTVKPERDHVQRESHRNNWWLFGEKRPGMRAATTGLDRFVAICRTAKHFVFQFVDATVLVESKVIAIAVRDAVILGILSSRIHNVWALRTGSRLENRPTYNNTLCFDPFPFPVMDESLGTRIRLLGEQLDKHRKLQQGKNSELTVTGMYNVLEKLRNGGALTAKEKVIHEQGLVSVLKQIHDDLDAAVFQAYGWPHDLTDEQILERLVALNAERAEEEKRGLIRWLRPEFQNPDNAGQVTQQQIEGASLETKPAKAATPDGKPPWPKGLPDQLTAIRDTFHQSTSALDASTVAKSFKGARTKEVAQVLASLEALGHLISVSDSPRQWRSAR